MCVTNIYVDVYPDGKRREFRQTSPCQYGLPGRPCAKTSTLENPPRKIQFDELPTEYMFTQYQRTFPAATPLTPPRSSGGSTHRRSGGYVSSSDDGHRRRKDSKGRSTESSKRKEKKEKKEDRPKREHRKERIVIVDAPPTPRTPPQKFNLPYTAPNSPIGSRGRPIIVDERPRPRIPSVGAVVGDRPPRLSRSTSRTRLDWETPSTSHTSFDLQAEERAKAEIRAKRNSRIAELEAEQALAERIRAHDEDIMRRPAIPLPTPRRSTMRPVVDQSDNLQGMMGGMRIDERIGDRLSSADFRRRQDDRELAAQLKREAEEQEAQNQRLRERQMPGRRFSVGPAQRRQRVLYSDGVYRWE